VETPGARALDRLGLTPNIITLIGFVVALGAAALVGAGFLWIGGLVFLAGALLDLMDGALARYTQKESRFGALLDSVFDRLGEAALFVGIAVYGLLEDLGEGRTLFLMGAVMSALITSQMVSYLRARGEGLGIFTKAGLMTRPERVVLYSLGLILGLRGLEVILIIVAAVSFLTLLQRLYVVGRGLSAEDSEGSPVGNDAPN
jgi:CDP-diacylglycerol--glycerol-3-phosphate 3-phosphatidyltransferase